MNVTYATLMLGEILVAVVFLAALIWAVVTDVIRARRETSGGQ
jgi:uncharacterized membrane protein YqiK